METVQNILHVGRKLCRMKALQFIWKGLRLPEGSHCGLKLPLDSCPLSLCLPALALYCMASSDIKHFEVLSVMKLSAGATVRKSSLCSLSLPHAIISPSLNKLRSLCCSLAKALGQLTLRSMTSICDVTDVTFERSTAPD